MAEGFIHPSALVESAHIGRGTRIWAYTHVMSDVAIGAHCNIGGHCFIESGAVIGDRVTIKNGNMIWDGVEIREGVFVGPQVVFTNDRYPRSPRLPEVASRYAGRSWLTPTIIERGASLGAGAVILAGVVVGEYSLVAAGSTLTRSLPAYALAVGAPARVRGWVCRCGQPLRFSDDTATCAECHLAFTKSGRAVRRVPEFASKPGPGALINHG